MANKDFRIGHDVKLSEKSKYVDNPKGRTFGNPLNMKGQIISFEEYVEICGEEDELADDWVYVEWDDGRVNCYPNNDSEDLIPF